MKVIREIQWEYSPKDKAIKTIMDHLVEAAAQNDRDFWNEGVELKVSWVTHKIIILQKEVKEKE